MRMRLEFHVRIVAQPHSACEVGAGLYRAPTHHRIDIEPQRALDRRSSARSSTAVSAHRGASLRFSEINCLNGHPPIELTDISKTDFPVKSLASSDNKTPSVIHPFLLILGCGAATVSLRWCDRFVAVLRPSIGEPIILLRKGAIKPLRTRLSVRQMAGHSLARY
jgi:hypothetical protein